MDMEYTVQEVQQLLNSEKPPVLLDVRTPSEWDIIHLQGAELLTQEFAESMGEWPPDTHIVCYCHHGIRSLQAAQHFAQQGFTNIRSMRGGVDAWAQEIDDSLPRY